jgi:hypothetical protein
MKNIFFLLMGIVWGGLGVIVLLDPDPFLYRKEVNLSIDLTGIKCPFGILLIALGICFVWSVFKKKTDGKTEMLDEKYLMCKKCIKPFSRNDVNDLKCPICDLELEALEGFYDRHPELKDTNH